MTELSWWYIVILTDPQSIKDISSLTPTPNLVIFICSCHSGLGEQECQPFLSTACEMRLMASDHWLNRVPGDLHPQWVRSTDQCHTFGKCHLLKASEVSWTHSMTAVYQAVIQPWNYIGLLVSKLQVRITITWKLPENTNSQLYTLSTEQDLGWDPTTYFLNFGYTTWLIGISGHWPGHDSEGTDSQALDQGALPCLPPPLKIQCFTFKNSFHWSSVIIYNCPLKIGLQRITLYSGCFVGIKFSKCFGI